MTSSLKIFLTICITYVILPPLLHSCGKEVIIVEKSQPNESGNSCDNVSDQDLPDNPTDNASNGPSIDFASLPPSSADIRLSAGGDYLYLDLFEGETITIRYKLIRCKSGTFKMGATSEQGISETFFPPHDVTLTKDFYIGETEVTEGLYAAVVANTIAAVRPELVKNYNKKWVAGWITFYDAMSFCTMASKKLNVAISLPTSAQWEYAARGGHKHTVQTRYAGSDDFSDVAYHDKAAYHPTFPKTKKKNTLGIYDMTGNAQEWTLDYASNGKTRQVYYSIASVDPTGPSKEDAMSGSHVSRGGGYSSNSLCLSNCYELNVSDTRYYPMQGFRIVLIP
ncbi:MAG: SUMF1/EgtB/PvdO family nonheme iron enzyme [Bacteroidales bacterium]|nr:SUMF1/EgtB/PvdO family nonheme iron enzyme [Bacteroidales bacterium]